MHRRLQPVRRGLRGQHLPRPDRDGCLRAGRGQWRHSLDVPAGPRDVRQPLPSWCGQRRTTQRAANYKPRGALTGKRIQSARQTAVKSIVGGGEQPPGGPEMQKRHPHSKLTLLFLSLQQHHMHALHTIHTIERFLPATRHTQTFPPGVPTWRPNCETPFPQGGSNSACSPRVCAGSNAFS